MNLTILILVIFAITINAQGISANARLIDGSGTFTGTTGSSVVTFTDSRYDGAFIINSNNQLVTSGNGANWISLAGTSVNWCISPGQSFVYVIRTDGLTSTIIAEAEVTSGNPDFKLFFSDEGFADSIYEVHAAVVSAISCTTELDSVNWTILQPVNL